ncbi:hypothetical protein KR093_008131 [Drosophila rubida]|uniref:Transmembrane protein 17B n=1 Tax=Drosophila rubida TaxID=30044 RepID=A0AAD4PQF1_9MUSC|nr:hypothetical protein KR093_008131 [Drosophila rubida]
MANIVMPVRSNLCLQILLQLDKWLAVLWTTSSVVHLYVLPYQRFEIKSLMAYMILITVELMRIYAGYVLNLNAFGSQGKWLLPTVIILSFTLITVMCCVAVENINTTPFWLRVGWHVWLVIIGLEVFVLLFVLYPHVYAVNRSQRWPKTDAMRRHRL